MSLHPVFLDLEGRKVVLVGAAVCVAIGLGALVASHLLGLRWPLQPANFHHVHLNVTDPATMKLLASAPFVLVTESFNVATGLGSRFGSELLKSGFRGRYNHIGTNKEGCGGLWQHMTFQGLDSDGIMKAVKALA